MHRDKNLALNFYLSQTNQHSMPACLLTSPKYLHTSPGFQTTTKLSICKQKKSVLSTCSNILFAHVLLLVGIPDMRHPSKEVRPPERPPTPQPGGLLPQMASESTKAFCHHRLHWSTGSKSDLQCSFPGHWTKDKHGINIEPITDT